MNRTGATILALAWSVPAVAHHGAGTFDLRGNVTFTDATLTEVELVNPHAWIYFEVAGEDGRLEQHRCEMRSAHVLRRSGWTADLFPAGARVTIDASPDRFDPNSCYLQTLVFADGARMDRYGQYVRAPDGALREVRGPLAAPDTTREPRLPNGEPNITGDWAPVQMVMADPRGVGGGLVRLDSLGAADQDPPGARGGRGRGAGGEGLYGGTTLTPLGDAHAARFARGDNPRFRCETTSIVFDWTFDGPVNRITRTDDTFVILYGQHGLERTVHMNMTRHPPDVFPTRAGHSIGSWDGDVLVVDTVRFLPGVLRAPVRHSDRLRVVERFALDPETMELTRTYLAEDPVYLEGAYTGSDVVQPADVPYAEDRCNEQAFIDYSQQQEP